MDFYSMEHEDGTPCVSPEQLVNANLVFSERETAALTALARSKPWRGEWDARFAAFADCVGEISEAQSGTRWQLVHTGSKRGPSNGRPHLRLRRIQVTGRLSVVTCLIFTRMALGATPLEAMVYAVTALKRFFPRSFARCRLVGGLLINDGRSVE